MAKRTVHRKPVARTVLKVVPIGNSRGVRLPKELRDRYAFKDSVIVEERAEGLLLRAVPGERFSWEETFKAIAREREDWSDWDAALGDGLDPDETW